MTLNISGSVVKRERADYEDIESKLINDGWQITGQIRDRVFYFQRSGINLTVVDGPTGTLVFPSGPVRGFIFGDGAVGVSRNTPGIVSTEQQNRAQMTRENLRGESNASRPASLSGELSDNSLMV